MMIPEIEADLVAIARDEVISEARFVPRDARCVCPSEARRPSFSRQGVNDDPGIHQDTRHPGEQRQEWIVMRLHGTGVFLLVRYRAEAEDRHGLLASCLNARAPLVSVGPSHNSAGSPVSRNWR